MIARLRGTVAATAEDHVIVDVGGVGYLVFASGRTLSELPRAGEPVTLAIDTQVREDAITLYGFGDPGERAWFKLLLNIQGVGARVALAILSVCPPESLHRAIMAQDKAMLTQANGVGPKLAARVLAELKDKVGTLPSIGGETPSGPVITAAGALPLGPADDAISALVNLGYGRAEAYTAVAQAQVDLGADTPVDALIRAGLRALSPA